MSYSQLPHWPLSGKDSGDKPISPEGVILGGGVIFPVLQVLTAIWQLTGESPIPTTVFLPLSLLSASFSTLALCLLAHLYVGPDVRKSAVFVQVVVALALIWGGYCGLVLGSRQFHSAVAYLSTVGQTPPITFGREMRSEPSTTPQIATDPPAKPSPSVWIALIVSIIAITCLPSAVAWAGRRFMASTRFRALICLVGVSWFLATIAWSRSAVDQPVQSEPSTVSASKSEASKGVSAPTNQEKVEGVTATLTPITGESIPILLMALVFAVPAYFSIPFLQLFIAECTNTTSLGRIWIVSTISSLAIIVLMAATAPRILEDNAMALSAAGLALAVICAWIVLPVIKDVPTSWTAFHVCAVTWMIGGYLLMGRPWRMTQEQLIPSLAMVSSYVAFTLLHMLLGLYSPKQLVAFQIINWSIIRCSFAVLIIAAWFPKYIGSAFTAMIWSVMLLGPYSTPPLVVFPRYWYSRFAAVRAVVDLLGGILGTGTPSRSYSRPWIEDVTNPMVVTVPEPVIAEAPLGTIRHRVPRAVPDGLRALTVAIVLPTALMAIPTYMAWQHNALRLPRDWIWVSVQIAGIAFSILLIYLRVKLGRHFLVLGDTGVGWLRANSLVQYVTHDTIRDITFSSGRLFIADSVRASLKTPVLQSPLGQMAANTLQVGLLDATMARYWSHLKEFGRVDFGPLSLSWEGLTVRGQLLDWPDVGRMSWSASSLTIAKRKGSPSWATIPTRSIPNPLCLRTMAFFFHGVQVFLANVTDAMTSNPADLEGVLRSVRGTNEFRLATGSRASDGMTEVFRYQLQESLGLKLELGMQSFPGAIDPAEAIAGHAWRELVGRISEFVDISDQFSFLKEPTSDECITGVLMTLFQNSPDESLPRNSASTNDATP